MTGWQWFGVAVGVVAVGAVAYVALKPPAPPPNTANVPNLPYAVDQGSAERTAWVTLATTIANTAGNIYTRESDAAAARAAAGASTPPPSSSGASDGGFWSTLASLGSGIAGDEASGASHPR